MEESNSQPDIFGTNDIEVLSQKLECPALSTSSTPAEKTLSMASTIQTGQRTTEQTITPAPWSPKRKTAEDYANDRVGKYAQYFEKGRILPIPELVEAVEPKTLSFVISDLRTRRLAGLKKETFEELLKIAGIPCRYFFRQSFATWDVLLLSEDQTKKQATGELGSLCATSRSSSMEISSTPTLAIMATRKRFCLQDRQPGRHTMITY